MGSRLKRLRLAAAHSLTLARLRAELAIDRQENMRFCRAEMPSYCVKALENTQSILCSLFLVCVPLLIDAIIIYYIIPKK